MLPARLLTVALALFLVAGACGDEPSPGTGPGSTSPTTGAGRFATTPVSVAGTQRGLLSEVSTEAAGSQERVTFRFEDALPGYRVAYGQRPLVEDGSGKEVLVEGEAVLTIHFEPASGVELSGDQVRTAYSGPHRIPVRLPTVTEVVRVSDFEANLHWAIGLRKEVPFRVQTLRGPPRVVVDFEPPAG